MFLAGQVMATASAMACPSQPAHHCGCGGKMPCCATDQTSAPQSPVTATVAPGSQGQFLAAATAAMIWVLPATETSSISLAIAISFRASAAPLFARHCAWLI